MNANEAKELQHASPIEPEFLLALIDERLKLLRFADRRYKHLVYDIESLYNDNIRFIEKVNALLTTPVDDLDRVASLVSDMWVDLEHAKLHIRSSSGPLRRLLDHVTGLAEKREPA